MSRRWNMEHEERYKSQHSYENGGFQMQENGTYNRLSSDSEKKRRKSIVQITKEVLPRLENYRNSRRAVKRPSLGELHGTEDYIKVI